MERVKSALYIAGLLWLLAACNNSTSPNNSLTNKDTTVISSDHTKTKADTSAADNVKPQVVVPDSLRH